MTRLPYNYDGLKESAAVEELRYKPVYIAQHFTFNIDDWENSKLIFIIPKGHMIVGGVSVRVEEEFAAEGVAVNAELLLGTSNNIDSIARVDVTVRGVLLGWNSPILPADSEFLRILDKDLKVYLVVTGTGTPTKGRGWGFMEYLNMNLVKGYR